MAKVLFVFPDQYFLDFLCSYYEEYDFITDGITNGISVLSKVVNQVPDLLLIYKNIENFDLKGFLVKKRIMKKISHISIFLVGDFQPDEILEYKKEKVEAFISDPINLQALTDRLFKHFNRKPPQLKKYSHVNGYSCKR